MKKLSNSKGKVHPSPPPPPATIDHRLSFLPATILTLAAALSPQDQQVLAYLISCSGSSSTNFSGHRDTPSGGQSSGGDHPPQFGCNCFRCYMSYWVKWDTSPNREVIHRILDEYEDVLMNKKKKMKGKKERSNKRVVEMEGELMKCDSGELGELGPDRPPEVSGAGGGDVEVDHSGQVCEVSCEKGAVRKLVSFIGERIWSVWGV